MPIIQNRTYEELTIGETASVEQVLSERDIALFAAMSGDVNPAHMDEAYAEDTVFHEVIGHGMWGGSLISAVLGTQLPGPGTIYLSQTLKFRRPVKVGDTVRVIVTVREKGEKNRVIIDCQCLNQDNDTVIEGEAMVIAPVEKVRREATERPRAVLYERGERIKDMIERARSLPPLKVAVVHPVEENSLGGALGAFDAGLIEPVLVGPRAKIEAAANDLNAKLEGIEIIEAEHSHAAAEIAVKMAARGDVEALMKGALHTDEIMGAALSRANGLRTERRVSHVYVMDTPSYDKLLLISDAAINIDPDLEAKRDITQNAIDLAHALGVTEPRVAILSAVETVYPKLASTIDAAALCKMADRKQITGGIVDGPLAFDNAISKDAAEDKGIISPVAGAADVLIVPDLEAGNMLAKQLDYLAGAVAAGLVLGARVPIILTSRAEGVLPRMASCAAASHLAHARAAAIKP
ncbi:MAG: bifunctional enoyl-CoA hydratase/phosphate acetyltransferase [Alphaproteobacteria bacterium]|nr:bifunctional enoyl-CoA hydratase/phosphate acetyltransferase [Alphaproteobacteria bacterium]